MGNGGVVDSLIHDGAVVRVRRRAHGHGHRAVHGPVRRHHPRSAGRRSRRRATSAPRRRSRKAASPRRSRRSRSRSARATRSSSTPTKVFAPARRPSRSAGCEPAFAKDGTITAGNASQISDGARRRHRDEHARRPSELGLTPLAELVSFGMVAGPDPSLLTQPSRAIKRALEPDRPLIADIDLFELNEAFAAVGLASMSDLGADRRHRERERRCHRARSPGRHVGRSRRAHADQRASPTRRRPRRSRVVRRRRPRRRRARAHALVETRPRRPREPRGRAEHPKPWLKVSR